MKRIMFVILTFAVIVGLTPGIASAAGPQDSMRGPVITVMTRNLYMGADLVPVITAATPAEFFGAVTTVFQQVQATDFPERAEAIADEIEAMQPDLVGLQEVVIWRTQYPADGPATPATDVAYDFLQILLDALEARGLPYEAIAVATGFDVEAPSTLGIDVRLTDRDVILARKQGGMKLSNIQTGVFSASVVFNTAVGPIAVPRVWTSVDVKTKGKTFRFVNTHLEPFSESVQTVQANELLTGPADTSLPLILLGDFNSRADGTGTATYDNLIGAGLLDAWDLANPADPGFTFGQDADLLNPDSALSERIDLVLFRGELNVINAFLVGEEADDRTPSGLWPSDHAGVVASLQVLR